MTKLVVLDTETSGLGSRAAVLEIAALGVDRQKHSAAGDVEWCIELLRRVLQARHIPAESVLNVDDASLEIVFWETNLERAPEGELILAWIPSEGACLASRHGDYWYLHPSGDNSNLCPTGQISAWSRRLLGPKP